MKVIFVTAKSNRISAIPTYPMENKSLKKLVLQTVTINQAKQQRRVWLLYKKAGPFRVSICTKALLIESPGVISSTAVKANR